MKWNSSGNFSRQAKGGFMEPISHLYIARVSQKRGVRSKPKNPPWIRHCPPTLLGIRMFYPCISQVNCVKEILDLGINFCSSQLETKFTHTLSIITFFSYPGPPAHGLKQPNLVWPWSLKKQSRYIQVTRVWEKGTPTSQLLWLRGWIHVYTVQSLPQARSVI